jgi:hypothetical protein
MYICMYVCVCVCVYVCMCICLYICMYVCVCIYMCMYICMFPPLSDVQKKSGYENLTSELYFLERMNSQTFQGITCYSRNF